jgi:hypothetical protein
MKHINTFLLALVFALTIALVVEFSSPYSIQPVANQQPGAQTPAEKKPESFGFRLVHDPVAAFTGILALSTCLLWWVTRTAANAARDAAEALPLIERAYVFVEVRLTEALIYSLTGNAPSDVEIHFQNHGKTPAMLNKVRGYCIIQQENPSALLSFEGSERELPQGLVIKSGGIWIEKVPARISSAQMGEIERSNTNLFCVGRIEYKDVMGKRYETGFCWRYMYHMQRGRFVIADDTKLNYYT